MRDLFTYSNNAFINHHLRPEQRKHMGTKINRRSKRRRQWSNTRAENKKGKLRKDRDTNRGPTPHHYIRLRLQVSTFFSLLHML
jgi:hypothetical protein